MQKKSEEEDKLVEEEGGELRSQQTHGMTRHTWKVEMSNKFNKFNN